MGVLADDSLIGQRNVKETFKIVYNALNSWMSGNIDIVTTRMCSR